MFSSSSLQVDTVYELPFTLSEKTRCEQTSERDAKTSYGKTNTLESTTVIAVPVIFFLSEPIDANHFLSRHDFKSSPTTFPSLSLSLSLSLLSSLILYLPAVSFTNPLLQVCVLPIPGSGKMIAVICHSLSPPAATQASCRSGASGVLFIFVPFFDQ